MTNAIKRAGRAAMWEVMKDRVARTPAQAATATNSSERDARYFLQMLANDKLLKLDTMKPENSKDHEPSQTRH
jgi:hypothetical protein